MHKTKKHGIGHRRLTLNLETLRHVTGGTGGLPTSSPSSNDASFIICCTDDCNRTVGGGGGSINTCFAASCETIQSQ